MSDPLSNILLNLLSDLIAWIIVFLIGGILYVSRRVVEQRHLVKFLGLTSQKTQFNIYLSSFLVKPGAVSDLDGKPTMWVGSALPAVEFLAVPEIDRWLSLVTKKSDFVDYLFNQIAPSQLRTSFIQLAYMPSPRSFEDLEIANGTALFVGGPLHNIGTKLYTSQNMTSMVSDDWRVAVHVTKGKNAGRTLGLNISPEEFQREFEKHTIDLGVLEKLYDKERNATIFIASGVATNGTRAAIHYLTTHWKELQVRYGESTFAVCLECPHPNVDPSGYSNYTVLMEMVT